jgi:hypothetical protein
MEIPELIRGEATTDVQTAGKLLGLGKNAAYAAATRGDFATIRMGGRIIVPVAPLLDLLGITDAGAE